ncbi:MAG: hypothetical protein LUF33_06990 [Clostridiales bacterium]|nr:hypothetical protein [Clostridiales bacterium]
MFDYNLFDNDNAKSKNGSALTAEKTEKKKPKNSAARIRANNKYARNHYKTLNIYIKKRRSV